MRTFGGYDTEEKEPQGWPADGKGGCVWTISNPPDPFQIEFYQVI